MLNGGPLFRLVLMFSGFLVSQVEVGKAGSLSHFCRKNMHKFLIKVRLRINSLLGGGQSKTCAYFSCLKT
jgi:hypothetical protein